MQNQSLNEQIALMEEDIRFVFLQTHLQIYVGRDNKCCCCCALDFIAAKWVQHSFISIPCWAICMINNYNIIMAHNYAYFSMSNFKLFHPVNIIKVFYTIFCSERWKLKKKTSSVHVTSCPQIWKGFLINVRYNVMVCRTSMYYFALILYPRKLKTMICDMGSLWWLLE